MDSCTLNIDEIKPKSNTKPLLDQSAAMEQGRWKGFMSAMHILISDEYNCTAEDSELDSATPCIPTHVTNQVLWTISCRKYSQIDD